MFAKHKAAQNAHLAIIKDALTPADGSVGKRWLSEAGGNEEGAMRAVESMIIKVRYALFMKWKMYGNIPWFSYRSNLEFENTLWATWIFRQQWSVVMRSGYGSDVAGAQHWLASANVSGIGRAVRAIAGAKDKRMMFIGDDMNSRMAKIGTTNPHSVARARQGNWRDPHRGINIVGRIDTPIESRKPRDWAKTFRPIIAPARHAYQSRSLADTPQQAIAKHARMLDLSTSQLGRREWDNR